MYYIYYIYYIYLLFPLSSNLAWNLCSFTPPFSKKSRSILSIWFLSRASV